MKPDDRHGVNEKRDGGVQVNRREFLKYALVSSSCVMLGGPALPVSAEGVPLGDWSPVSFPKLLLHNLRLFDGVEDRLQDGVMVLIEGDRILGIEREGELSSYTDYMVVDLKGRTLLPGLIDNHVHITVPFMYDVNLDALRQMNEQIVLNFRNCIMGGVTTVRDVGGFPGKINKYRKLSDDNEIPGPRVVSSLSPIAARDGDTLGAPPQAPYFTNPIIKWILGGNYAERPTTIEEIETACEKMIGLGAQWLKTLHQDRMFNYAAVPLPNHSDGGYRTILEVGKKNGMKCALHAPFLNGFQKGVELGFHTFEHMPNDNIIPDELIDGFMNKDMAMMPTLMIYGDYFLTDELIDIVQTDGEKYLVPEAARQSLETLKGLDTEEREYSSKPYVIDVFPNVAANLMKLHDMGATIGAGSDIGGTRTGFFGRFTDELKHYAAAGIPNSRILHMATSINARILDMAGEIGAVKKGMQADLIAVAGDPIEDLNALDNMDLVLKGGVVVHSNVKE